MGAATATGKPSPLRTGLLVAGIVLAGANLRASLTSVGPLVGEIRADTGVSGGAAGLLTTLPLICFAAFSLLAPALARGLRTRLVLTGGLILLAAGIALRSAPPVAALFAGTVVLGLAIAVGNVLLPSLVKRDFPARAGLVTGVYITVMNSGAALGSGVGVPLAHQLDSGWRGALGVWAPLALVAAAVWLFLLRGDGLARYLRRAETSTLLCLSTVAWAGPVGRRVDPGIQQDRTVGLASDVAFQAPHGLLLGLALRDTPGDVRSGALVAPQTVERHHV